LIALASLALPLLRCLEPERAHRLTLWALAHGLVHGPAISDDPILATDLWGKKFSNPVGLAAGFDKNAVVPDAMLRLGFGFVEVGSVTPRPQPGNPQPRLFRLNEDAAVINRLGFNNEGHDAVAARLLARARRGIVGVNLGANKDSADRTEDYVIGLQRLGRFADYVVINVSSPNTPGLRALQGPRELDDLLARLEAAAAAAGLQVPLVLKIAPDLAPDDLADIAAVALGRSLAGVAVSNTTIGHRDGLRSKFRSEVGGLSGRPLFETATAALAEIHRRTGGRIPLIGVGGVASGADAYAKIRAGASLVQLYTALIYAGPGLIGRIKRELAAHLRADGFQSVTAAVGSGAIPRS
jgi:dihydroorotate dehydrogenase